MGETPATLPSTVRSTVSGALGDPLRVFAEPGPAHEADVTFDEDARNSGGGPRPLPPALFYRG